MIPQINIAKNYFYNKNYAKALEIFEKEEDFYACGLCSLLTKNLKCAKEFWLKNNNNSNASKWGLIVLDLIDLKIPKIQPSFFQTRAFLEVYINLFIENQLVEWAQNLVNMCDYLYQANPESYKFIARALFANGYIDLAIEFCKKTIGLFNCDPEAMLILSQCYFILGNLGDALDYVNRVNDMIDGYYPAILFREILKEEIKKKHEKEKS